MRRNDGLFDLADWLTDAPSGGPVQKWGVGIALAAITALYGVSCCLSQRATWFSSNRHGYGSWLVELTGASAVCVGLLFICVGLFMHFQWFWGSHEKLQRYFEIGKYASVCGVVASMAGYVVVAVLY